ncbi:PDR/VanB family oxidoreductase [Microbacterium sp. cx-55]|uniref:PDR/VanB family oxidoreductase n=1 Tax=unclassified Microbacterium TaxID=2609290 RepID=UPI001CC12496|nr:MULTISPECIES: PDR/VanB family oxidoreductase [unclassified Microbacterium]MBZ4487132.1 PDR/VanB family oxidoreductase [Microbacterium sp. cx-55]MCC4908742.1 PDR/VanB family oxidoreductase [Microbacterium sp. cx-59]UGB35167.1 PDR/VanB family oxidoreductase [Microbacterium sp. cx-55]
MTNDAQRHSPPELPRGFVDARVVRRRQISDGVVLLDLDVPTNSGTTTAAGSHIEVFLPLGVGGEVRHYSVCRAEEGTIQIAVLRETDGRGGSAWMHDHADVGVTLMARGPRNTFTYAPTGPALFIAGGIGITPILPMIEEAREAAIDWKLVYAGRSLASMVFADELVRAGGDIALWPADTRGRVDLGEVIAHTSAETTIYACGPDRMLTELRALCAVSGHTLVSEDFSIGRMEEAASVDVRVESDDREFTVELADGTEVVVPRGCSILTALGGAGIRTLSSCQRGECGTCETPIISGEADHRDRVLSEEERAANEVMMICISRAKGDRLVLDL